MYSTPHGSGTPPSARLDGLTRAIIIDIPLYEPSLGAFMSLTYIWENVPGTCRRCSHRRTLGRTGQLRPMACDQRRAPQWRAQPQNDVARLKSSHNGGACCTHARTQARTVMHAHTARSMQRCAAACQTETQSVSRMHEWLCCFAAGGGLVCRVQQRTARFYMYDIGSDFGMAAIEVIHPCAAPVSIVSDSPRPAPPRFPTHQQTRIDALTHTLTPPRPPPPGRLVMDR
jgi:hypothetical protein